MVEIVGVFGEEKRVKIEGVCVCWGGGGRRSESFLNLEQSFSSQS